MKLPKLSKPAIPAFKAPSRSTGSGPRLDLPAPVKSFWNDLRARHLALPVVLLIVAIIAVPFVLGGSGAAPVTGGTPLPAGAEGQQVEAAVLAEQTGIRNYRKRLEALRSKNPFAQQFPISEDTGETTVPVGEGGAGVSVASPTDTATSTGASEPVTGAGSDPSVSTTSPAQSVPSGETGSSQDGTAAESITFFAGAVDLTIGRQGNTKDLDDVLPVASLPSRQDPVVAFIGLSSSLETAYFVVSDSVVRTSGDGRCTPKELEGCQVLELGVGDERLLTVAGTETGAEAPRAKVEAEAVGADGASEAGDQARSAGSGSEKAEAVTYRLKVRSIDVIEVDDPRKK